MSHKRFQIFLKSQECFSKKCLFLSVHFKLNFPSFINQMGIYSVLFSLDLVSEKFTERGFLHRKEFYKLINVSKTFLKFDFIKALVRRYK